MTSAVAMYKPMRKSEPCNCKEMAGHKAQHYLCVHNNFAILYPELVESWHPDNILRPEKYFAGSDKRVKWQCAKNKHIWETSINHRASGSGCPFCQRADRIRDTNLAKEYPLLCEEWDHSKNEKGPKCYSVHSKQCVFWICPANNNHRYAGRIQDRTGIRKKKCTICKSDTSSRGENIIKDIFEKMDIVPYEYNQSIHGLFPKNNRLYNFVFCHNDINWVLEYDGKQHFDESSSSGWFNKNNSTRVNKSFPSRREIDIEKTIVAIDAGYQFIRIDYTNKTEKEITKHIIKAFELCVLLYVSNEELYSWIGLYL
jgi:hypothetical protein